MKTFDVIFLCFMFVLASARISFVLGGSIERATGQPLKEELQQKQSRFLELMIDRLEKE